MSEKSSTVARIEQASKILGLEPWLVDKLLGFKFAGETDMTVKMSDGSLKRFTAVLALHRSPHTDQPHKGGLRFHPGVNITMMKDHAMEMSLKCWVMGLELGGGKSGIALDPYQYTAEELKAITEMFVDEMDERKLIDPVVYVPAPDMGTNSKIMNWIRQHYAQKNRTRKSSNFAAVVTGKPTGYGFWGIEGRTEATGFGLIEVLKTFLKLNDLDKKKFKRVAVMGFGNVGFHTALHAIENGFDIVAISDVFGGAYNKNGFTLADIQDKKDTREITNAKQITAEELLFLSDINVLVPAALENVITKDNAGRIKAKIILEGANGPTTCEADSILESKGIFVIPDILANAGGVTVSFFEWSRNMGKIDERVPVGTRDEVLCALSMMMKQSTKDVFEMSRKHHVSMRLGAYMLAIERTAPLFRTKHTAV